LLVTANIPGSLILVTLKLEGLHSSKTLILTRATWCNIPEDGIYTDWKKKYKNVKLHGLAIVE
jgi:hypothetical protein